MRLRLTALALARLPQAITDTERTGLALANRARLIAIWYERIAARVGRPGHHSLATLDPPALDGSDAIDPAPGRRQAYYTIWVQESLHHLTQHLDDLVAPAEHVAQVRGRPWWR
jgi:hypothetical protein